MNVPPALRYTALRVLLFLAVLGILALLRVHGLLLLALAVLVSGLLSYSLLSRQRDAMSSAIAAKAQRIRDAMEEGTRAEDEADERARAEREAAEPRANGDGPPAEQGRA